jgi:replicative DNA helicase
VSMDADEDRAFRAVADPWPPLQGGALPPFPTGALPREMEAWVVAVSEESQTPPDLAALSALGVLSAAAMGAVVDCGSWQEELPLYVLVAMPSGDRKSTVLRAAVAPLRDLERERRDAATPGVNELRTRRDVLEVRKRKLTKTAGEQSNAEARKVAEAELADVDERLVQIGEPVLPRMLADDLTPEALGGLLAQHGSIAILAAESAFLDNLSGRYSENGANLHLICAAYHGESTMIDRRNRDPEIIDRPLVTVALAVQPHVLSALVEHPIARAQGLVSRFAYALPTTALGRRRIDAPPAQAEIHEQWRTCVRRVADRTDRTPRSSDSAPRSVGFVGVSLDTKINLSLSLSDRASEMLHELRAEQEPRLAETGDLRPMADWAARHPGRVARIAGLLHLVGHMPEEPIGEDTMLAALRIGGYLLAHAVAALTGPDELTRRALQWLTSRGRPSVSVRELQRGPMGARGTAGEATGLADQLVEYGALRLTPAQHTGPGRPPSPSYEVHPDHLRHADRTDRTVFAASITADAERERQRSEVAS